MLISKKSLFLSLFLLTTGIGGGTAIAIEGFILFGTLCVFGFIGLAVFFLIFLN